MDIFFKIVPILISLLALVVSWSNKRTIERENQPLFRIVQNLWTEKPYYELINEANSKLDRIPSPSYMLLVPSKVYWVINGKVEASNLVLSPISYTAVQEQITTGNTTSTIVKSTLPNSFFGRKGVRDNIVGEKMKLTDGIELVVSTYPFLVIVSEIDYSYKNKWRKEIKLSTPLDNLDLSPFDYENLKDYVRDNAKNEIAITDDTISVYQDAQNYVQENVHYSLLEKGEKSDTDIYFMGGKEGGYGDILKKVNGLISPIDPLDK